MTATATATATSTRLERFSMMIGGEAVEAVSGERYASENPYLAAAWASVPDAAPEDVDRAVAAARAALGGEWGSMTGFQRAALLRRFADLVAESAEWLAQLEVNDSGKLFREMVGQTRGLGGWYLYYAGLADKLEGRQIPTPNPDYLAGAVWTKDVHRAHRVAARIRAGTIWINAYRVVSPSVPFGGVGWSGLGRENGVEAVNEYLENKSVWVELSGGTRDPFTLG